MKSEITVTKISKWGNGYGIRLPINTLKSLQLFEGSEVELVEQNNSINISPRVPSMADLSLAEILKNVTPTMLANDGAENFFGKRQGNEVW